MDEPVYYEANPKLTEEQVEWVLHAFRITPILCSIYVQPEDFGMATRFSTEVLRTKDMDSARSLALELAGELQRPSVVIGDAQVLDAIYPDGKRECLKN